MHNLDNSQPSTQPILSVHSDHYDTFTSGSGNSEEHVSYPITPPVSDQCPAGRELTHQDHDDDTDEPPKKKVYSIDTCVLCVCVKLHYGVKACACV